MNRRAYVIDEALSLQGAQKTYSLLNALKLTPERSDLLNRAIDAARNETRPFSRKTALQELAPALPADRINEVLPLVSGAGSDEDQAEVLRELAFRIPEKQQEELVKTRKRLRTVYSLLSAALLALLIAGYFWLESNSEKEKAKKAEQLAMIQKDSAVLAKEVADKALKKVNEQIAIISKKDFDNLKKRTEPITDAGGCPNEILEQMDSIATTHPDSLIMKYDIQSIREKCPQ